MADATDEEKLEHIKTEMDWLGVKEDDPRWPKLSEVKHREAMRLMAKYSTEAHKKKIFRK
jgi:hypothetical protein